MAEVTVLEYARHIPPAQRLDKLERPRYELPLRSTGRKRVGEKRQRFLEQSLVGAVAVVTSRRGQRNEPADYRVDAARRRVAQHRRRDERAREGCLHEHRAVAVCQGDDARNRFLRVRPRLAQRGQGRRLSRDSRGVTLQPGHLHDELRLDRSTGDQEADDVARRAKAGRENDA